ncbi:MAG: hypothetical protein ABII90_07645 [Bacteroidota bacterium]
MKTNYFTKVENKYVFNLSLIFWHIFITLASLAIIAGIALFIWCIIPPSEKEVAKRPYPVKPSYPEKKPYPQPVTVDYADLQLEETKEEAPPPPPEITGKKQIEKKIVQPKLVEDTKGKDEYNLSLATLRELIPPQKYSWASEGIWSYPEGKRYWD